MGKHRDVIDFSFNFSFLRSTLTFARIVYSRLEWSAFFTLATLLTAISREVVNYYSGLNLGKFYSALTGKDENAFWSVFTESTLLYIALCMLISFVGLFSSYLYISYRSNLVEYTQKLYLRTNSFYHLNCVDDGGIDNPDQRLSQDVERACNILATKILPVAILAPFTISFYTYKTWIVAGPFGVGIIYGYFIVGTIISRLLLPPITKWAARVERAEGDFRYKHVSIRDHAEEIAFYRASLFEEGESTRLFSTLISKQKRLILWQLLSQFFQSFFNFFGGSLSYVIQVFPVFVFHSYDDVDPTQFGQIISNNAFLFIYLINSFTNLTDLATSTGEFAGYVQRITELVKVGRSSQSNEEIKEGRSYSNDVDSQSSQSDEKIGDESALMELTNLSYSSPDDQLCNWSVRNFSCSVSRFTHLLITGPSGVGKSSLMRCIAGLWSPITGQISKDSSMDRDSFMFLPQRPYFPVGRLSLKQQVVFPTKADEVPPHDDHRIMSIIHSLSLARLLIVAGDLNDEVDFEWGEQLSLGEQQRLSLCRVFFHRPSIVFLDESTSSLSESAEKTVYNLLDTAKIGYVSTGHRSTLIQYHNEIINIDIDGIVTSYHSDELRF